jgi:hypothetical protein
MRERFDLNLSDLARATYLVHGNYGVGKTFLLGDALKYEMSLGKKAHFLSFKDEEGHNSIVNLGLGQIAERVETYDDFIAALADCKKDGVDALAIDNLKWLGRATIKKHCGDRLPSVGRGSDDWQKIHKDFEEAIGKLRWTAPTVVCAASSDRSMDQISGEISLTPDFPGRQAAGSGGLFDFVFVLRATTIGPGKIKRVLCTAPQQNTVIRARLPRPLPHEIELPENGGGWKALQLAIQHSLEKAGK